MTYKKPFDITSYMLELISNIMSSIEELKKLPKLRKNNRIQTIHPSLTITQKPNSRNQRYIKKI